MKLTYKNGKAELFEQGIGKVLNMDIRGDADLKSIMDLRRQLGKAAMLLSRCLELEPCPACGSREVSVRVLGLFFDIACDCGKHGVYGRTVDEATRYWNIEAKELRERRAKE